MLIGLAGCVAHVHAARTYIEPLADIFLVGPPVVVSRRARSWSSRCRRSSSSPTGASTSTAARTTTTGATAGIGAARSAGRGTRAARTTGHRESNTTTAATIKEGRRPGTALTAGQAALPRRSLSRLKRQERPSAATSRCRKQSVVVIVDHPDGLHQRIADGRPDEAEAEPPQGAAHRGGRRRSGPGISASERQRFLDGPAVDEIPQKSRQPPVCCAQLEDAAARCPPPPRSSSGCARCRGRRASRRRAGHRTGRPSRGRSRRTPAGSPRACAGWSASSARPGPPRGRASRTAPAPRAPARPTGRRGRRRTADRFRTRSSGAVQSPAPAARWRIPSAARVPLSAAPTMPRDLPTPSPAT